MMNIQKQTSTVVCPYDRNHLIDRSRFQNHIVKCRKNFPPGYMDSCPYNATHIMPPSELEQHINSCSDKRYLQPEKYITLKNHGSLRSCPPSLIEKELTECDDEMWEDHRMADFSDTLSVRCPSNLEFETNLFKTPTLEPIRPPKSRGLAFMMDYSECSSSDDLESIKSGSTVFTGGRGQKIKKAFELSRSVSGGLGHGSNHR